MAIHESQAEESRFKEENTSLKRKINRTHSEMEAVSGELNDLNRIDRGSVHISLISCVWIGC